MSDAATIFDDSPMVRVRFPPSPTGSLHVGGGRTALFNWLFSHGQAERADRQGRFILRIEDTDRNRYVPEAAAQIVEILEWFGITWEEGPDKGGPRGPYVQSERTVFYRNGAERLIASGHAYRCFCTPERLQAVREAQQARGEAPGYDRHCRNLPHAEVAEKLALGETYVVRFKMPREGETRVHDLLREEMVFQNVNLEDLVLLKSDGYPTYHLANVIDDHMMEITHIMRGADWIPSAPLHIQLYHAFGWDAPKLAHLPLILAPGGGKLSKRHGATAMEEFRDGGYLPEALMNYLVLLGWSYDGTTEIFSKDELLEKFTLERISPSPATFDHKKLEWFNQHYINHVLTLDDLTARIVPFLANAGIVEPGAADPESAEFASIRAATALLKDRLRTLAEAPELMSYFLVDELPPYDAALLAPKKTEPAQVIDGLTAVLAIFDEIDLNDEAGTEAKLRAIATERGLKAGQLFMPIRVAVTGRTESPGLFETLRVIGAARVKSRLEIALARLSVE